MRDGGSVTVDSTSLRASHSPCTVKFGTSPHGIYSPNSLGEYISPDSSSLSLSIKESAIIQKDTEMTPRSLIQNPGGVHTQCLRERDK